MEPKATSVWALACAIAVCAICVTACASVEKQVKSSNSATCGSSCKNLPAESQSDCIMRCKQ